MINTNVIASAPNIKGDVSSCSTVVTTLENSSRTSLFYIEDTGWSTNNCTGETQQFNSWELSGISMILIVIFGIALVVGVCSASSSYY